MDGCREAAERRNMAEYLSPGVYVEEFDSGIKAMEGVGTSTAGFVGMAKKGPVKGTPVLITSMADYQRRFGGYLSERDYGNLRFLPYAVEQFFNNGGSSCYVMRVCGGEGTTDGPKSAEGSLKCKLTEKTFLKLTASNPGAWGNGVAARFRLITRNKTKVRGPVADDGGKIIYELEDASWFQADDLVCLQQAERGKPFCFGLVKEVDGTKVILQWQGSEAKNLQFPENAGGGGTQGGGSPENGGTGEGGGSTGGGTGEGGGSAEGGGTQGGGAPGSDPKPKAVPAVFMYLAEWEAAVWDDTMVEQYEGVSFHPGRSNYVEHMLKKSRLVSAEAAVANLAADGIEGFIGKDHEMCFELQLSGGSDGKINKDEVDAAMYLGKDGVPDERTGLAAFLTLSDVSIMAIPGIVDKAVQSALVSHCEGQGNRFAVLDMPLDCKDVSELQEFRENVDSSYAAMYHPWLTCYDVLAKRSVHMPPSGAVAGIYGRTDNARGVHKAPANEVVRSCTGLSVNYNEAEQAKLNPKGINLIRALPGQGIRVWGARTCSSDGNWKYVNVRRLFIFIEESIRVNTNWAVFEPNDEMLWSRVEGTIRVFLTTQWRNGALAGAAADEAFFVNIGKSTMTQDDILNGRLICVIGVAPVRPAEFVIFRITQKMESAQ